MCCQQDPVCQAGRVVTFGASTLLHNNLDGAGPSSGEPALTLRDVVLGSSRTVNLEIFATGPYEPEPEYLALNGLYQRHFAQIFARSGSQVDLLLRFIDHASWRPLVLEPYYLTVFNLEGARIGIAGIQQYFLSQSSKVTVELGTDGLLWFAGGPAGTHEELSVPSDPLLLTEAQRRRAVTFLVGDVEALSFTYAVDATQPGGGRLLLGGASGLACASTAASSTAPAAASMGAALGGRSEGGTIVAERVPSIARFVETTGPPTATQTTSTSTEERIHRQTANMSLEEWLQAQVHQAEQDAIQASESARGVYTTTTADSTTTEAIAPPPPRAASWPLEAASAAARSGEEAAAGAPPTAAQSPAPADSAAMVGGAEAASTRQMAANEPATLASTAAAAAATAAPTGDGLAADATRVQFRE